MLRSILAFALTRRPIIMLCLLGFMAAGAIAFTKLNIEAYPNPAPVILEITAQAPGLSAEEMERYYTIPMEVGLASTPGVDTIRSTSFYGLSFVRVTFKYGVDYYFAYQMASLNLQQNVSLPNNVQPQIQASSLVGEMLRYQVVGPPHFGLTNLRTIQDWILQRRLLTIPGVAQIVTWGGTTKEYEVEADLHKLEAYNVTLPQLVSSIGNANVNVGGRTINIGQQSVNIRGVGLIDSGGANDLTQGWHVDDIKNTVLTQSNGVPVQIKDVANVTVGSVPRLGKAGRDNEDDVVTAIVVMNRTMHTNDVLPRVKEEIAKINSDGTLPPGVKVVPFYDRTTLVDVTTHTVLHNLIFGCLLVFLIQWIFLGDLRSAIIVGINIPFALFFSVIILVLRGEDEFGELQEAKKRLEVVVPLSLLLILALLYGLFNSLTDSLLVLAGIPFAVAGGILALFVSGMDFSISAAVGFISLFGVSVMNGILLVTYYNQIRLNDGMSPAEAMFQAAERQMRPMLMMALSACIGLLPAALSTSIGSEVQRPLAVVVVGGMLIGPVMLLVVVPALQLLFLGKSNDLTSGNTAGQEGMMP